MNAESRKERLSQLMSKALVPQKRLRGVPEKNALEMELWEGGYCVSVLFFFLFFYFSNVGAHLPPCPSPPSSLGTHQPYSHVSRPVCFGSSALLLESSGTVS